jgi:hypothetical protein
VFGAPIGQAGGDGAPALDQSLAAARVHGTSNAGTVPNVQVTTV